jgi:hypothetical protein
MLEKEHSSMTVCVCATACATELKRTGDVVVTAEAVSQHELSPTAARPHMCSEHSRADEHGLNNESLSQVDHALVM